MRRRSFLRTTLVAAAATALPRRALYPLPRGASAGQLPDVGAVTGDGRAVTLRGRALADLRDRLYGRLLLADDAAYDDARRILNPTFDRYPALIVQVSGVADTRAAVDFARENGGLLVAVKCGGHSLSGKSTCDRGMMIDLSRFRDVHVDPARRRARVTGGSLLGHVDHECMAHGLVTPLGTVSHTGVGGLVTGGGFGRLARRYGLSIDNLVSADVVTADGGFLHASESENADLFWGVRGGGGNFGIVTSFEFRLQPLSRQVIAGRIVHPFARARDVLSVFGDYGPGAPDTLQLDPFVAPPAGDNPGAAGFGLCYSGPAADLDRTLAPLRRLGSPLADTVGPVDYVALQRSGDIDDPRAVGLYTKSGFITAMTDDLIRAILDGLAGDPRRGTLMVFQQSGGAINRVPADAAAFPQRHVLANMLCFVDWPFAADAAPHIRWIQQFWGRLEPFTDGFYINDLETGHTPADVRANYRRNHDRLVQVKNRYDPNNLFRLNANIQPTVRPA
jgi:FAD/FMN-containing dehydrogenase